MNEKYLSKVANIQLVNVLLILDDIYRPVFVDVDGSAMTNIKGGLLNFNP